MSRGVTETDLVPEGTIIGEGWIVVDEWEEGVRDLVGGRVENSVFATPLEAFNHFWTWQEHATGEMKIVQVVLHDTGRFQEVPPPLSPAGRLDGEIDLRG